MFGDTNHSTCVANSIVEMAEKSMMLGELRKKIEILTSFLELADLETLNFTLFGAGDRLRKIHAMAAKCRGQIVEMDKKTQIIVP